MTKLENKIMICGLVTELTNSQLEFIRGIGFET